MTGGTAGEHRVDPYEAEFTGMFRGWPRPTFAKFRLPERPECSDMRRYNPGAINASASAEA